MKIDKSHVKTAVQSPKLEPIYQFEFEHTSGRKPETLSVGANRQLYIETGDGQPRRVNVGEAADWIIREEPNCSGGLFGTASFLEIIRGRLK